MRTINYQEITEILPHRYPMLLIDRVIDYEPNVFLQAIKNVTNNEPQFIGHFPDMAVMPGVLILEAMAQATGVFAHVCHSQLRENPKKKYYLAAVDKCRFRSLVVPGDTLVFDVVNKGNPKRGIWKFIVKASVDEKEVASAEIMCAAR